MSILQNKMDFVAVIEVKNANPNGDPLNENMPRVDFDGFGEISDVCIKRKIRNRLLDMGESIFVQSDDKKIDAFGSLRERAESNEIFGKELKKGKKADSNIAATAACQAWMDVRSFGQVFAFKNTELSLGIRGPVTVQSAFSADPVDITSIQITKSVNGESKEGKASDTMGMKHRVDFGVYLLKGSINVQLAEKTGFSEEDAEKIKEAIRTLFVNDCSSARPEGSMQIVKLFWWKHNCKIGQYSAKKVHDSVEVVKKEGIQNPSSIEDYTITCHPLEGLAIEEYEGL